MLLVYLVSVYLVYLEVYLVSVYLVYLEVYLEVYVISLS